MPEDSLEGCWITPLPDLSSRDDVVDAVDVYREVGDTCVGRIIVYEEPPLRDGRDVCVERDDLDSERIVRALDGDEDVSEVILEMARKLVAA